jgi:hypothetical protein
MLWIICLSNTYQNGFKVDLHLLPVRCISGTAITVTRKVVVFTVQGLYYKTFYGRDLCIFVIS